MFRHWMVALAAAGVFAASPALAQLSVEANGARADGHWGGELGAGYGFGAGGFRLTPGAGVLIYSGHRYDRDGERHDETRTRLYGRLEATYSIPMSATIGAGLRVGRDTHPYVTAALPLMPRIGLKGNAGPHYLSLGLKLGL